MRTTRTVIAIALLGAGCVREHLTETQGRSTREVFAAQRANPDAPAARPPAALQGLDSQEATIIAETFLKSLAPKGEQYEEPRILMVNPTPGRPAQPNPRPLPPSVPKQ
jgi:hypothetical protein